MAGPDTGAARRLVALADPGPEKPAYEVEGIESIRSELEAGHPVWIDIEAPTPWEIEQIRSVFSFHPLALEDVHHAVQRPKIEEYDDHLFLTVYGFRREGKMKFVPLEVNAFVGRGFLVTFHEEPVPSIQETRSRCEKGRLSLDRGPDFLLHGILDGLVDTAFPLVDSFDEEIDKIESLFMEQPDRKALQETFETRKNLLRLRRVLQPHAEILAHLSSKEYPYISRTVQTYFRDVYDHVLRILDTVDSSREVIDAAVDTYLSQATENTNQVMKTLTVIATLGIPLTVMTGFFGMNFEHMEIFRQPSGLWVFFGITAAIEIALLAAFRWKGWL
jgi:magnesium transporter